jgi:LPXTG-motif cell wall-anchored protein
MGKKVLLSLSTIVFFIIAQGTQAAYTEVKCTVDPAYEANSCNQCFTADAVAEGTNLGLLTDEWFNNSSNDQIVYKEEQKNPSMVNLSEGNVTWSQTPSADGFWEPTPEFNNLFTQKDEGNILKAGQKVMWLKSKLGYAYKLERNTAPAGANIWLLVYPIKAHNILKDGQITLDDKELRECVLFKSAKAVAPITPQKEVPQKPVELPKTGPEHIVLLLIAMLIGTGLILFRKKA